MVYHYLYQVGALCLIILDLLNEDGRAVNRMQCRGVRVGGLGAKDSAQLAANDLHRAQLGSVCFFLFWDVR